MKSRWKMLTLAIVVLLSTLTPGQSAPLAKLDGNWTTNEIHPGLTHYQRHFTELFGGPQIVNVLAVAPDHPNVAVELTAADVWGLTRQPIPQIARHAGAIAAINGGFAPGRRFEQVGYGIMKFRGEVWPFVNDSDFHEAAEGIGRNAIGVDEHGRWHFKTRGARGDEIGARWDEDWPEVTDAMAGGSLLVIDGKVNPLIDPHRTQGAYRELERLRNRVFRAHPHTAIGVTPDNVVLLVTVDGRHEGKADGMTLHELARLMLNLGCEGALELDGGGSTTMWLRDAQGNGVVNYPTDNKTFDHAGLRPLRLAVLVMERQAKAPAVEWSPMFRGVDHYTFTAQVPQPIVGHAVRIDTREEGIAFVTTPAAERNGGEVLSQTASSFVQEHGVSVGVNASTFRPVVSEEGHAQDVRGLHISAGRLVSEHTPGRPAFAVTDDNRPFFIQPDEAFDDAHHALAGFYMILHDGEVVQPDAGVTRPAMGVHPRTAIGVSRDERYVYLLTIDGRQPGYSEGADIDTLARLLREIGAWTGLNMDGGGSTALVVRNAAGELRQLNRPIHRGQPGTERPNANHLGIRALPLPASTLEP